MVVEAVGGVARAFLVALAVGLGAIVACGTASGLALGVGIHVTTLIFCDKPKSTSLKNGVSGWIIILIKKKRSQWLDHH